MKTGQFKKLVLVSAASAMLAACGGGGSTPAAVTPPSVVAPASIYTITSTISPTPNYSHLGIDQNTYVSGFSYQPAGTVFATGMDGKKRVFIFPTLFYLPTQLPGIEFVETSADTFSMTRFLDDVTMGNARDWKLFDIGNASEKKFVIVDHGSELASGYQDWPFGYVWVATDSGTGFNFKKISSIAAFNHSVAVGNLTNTGRDDVVAINMGVKPGGISNSLHRFSQTANDVFTPDVSFASDNQFGASGAVAIADLIGDGALEVVQGGYLINKDYPAIEWGAIRIWNKKADGSYSIAATLPREGNFVGMGATQITPVDIDNDGLTDLVVFLEGATPDSTTRYNAIGVEIYKNLGGFKFTRATDQLLAQSVWRTTEFQARELAVADINGDGYKDIVFHGWGGTALKQGNTLNVGSLILLNNTGKGFLSQRGVSGSTVSFNASTDLPKYLRFVGADQQQTKLFGITNSGAPVVINIRINK
jgi:hypothetical protein